ncbi:MAG: twin-arginine translocase TatA/TatE family subunit [Acidobacteriota bacterium]|nr:twin-arginine translocase TatA/TatE family subunit [Acidobacteriota bacterium]MDH3527922.1 twin-arginine translocase TatA/TatE family subunit [Acidobacteriota bacterium]
MFLFILESLGTWELLLVGMVALVVFGPRRIPELARKAGKMMAEFRKVSNDFRSTWEREAALGEDEKNAFNFSDEALAGPSGMPEEEHPSLKEANIGGDSPEEPAADVDSKGAASAPSMPEIREITDEAQIEKLKTTASSPAEEPNDKEDWF